MPHRLSPLLLVVLCLGCSAPEARWRAGAFPEPGVAVTPPKARRAASGIEVYFKDHFGAFEDRESERYFACSTTTIMRKSFLVDPGPRGRKGAPDRDWRVLGEVTTEEFPRDARRSRIIGVHFSTLFGFGTHPRDLFVVRMDPRTLAEATARLRAWADRLGADAVIDVYATGAAEYHSWSGFALGFDSRSPHSLLYADGKLLDFQLRDVRLHGVAVRYE